MNDNIRPARFIKPGRSDAADYETLVPLIPAFRFAHEPVRTDQAQRYVGRRAELETLVERILFSEGGSFLVTGYRGVGKTSFVNQVVRRLEEHLPQTTPLLGESRLLDIQLNLARPLEPKELMHHIIRRLYDRLEDKNLLPRLSAKLKDELVMAYQRTSYNMARKLAESTERSFGIGEASLGAEKLRATLKTSFLFKKSRSQNYEMTFLGYDDKAAEFDIIRLAQKLTEGYDIHLSFWQRVRQLFRGKTAARARLKIVFVFDELDKLEEFTAVTNGKAKPFIDEILGVLKNLFTTSGISFIFVAGKDLQERWLEDLGRGDSVYESVFCYDKYLPCMWADVDSLCDGLVAWEKLASEKISTPPPPPSSATKSSDTVTISSPTSLHMEGKCPQCRTKTEAAPFFCPACGAYLGEVATTRLGFEDFKKYLAYKGRGIPRRIIRGFNEYVQWHDRHPVLAFTRQDLRRMRFYAGLQSVLMQNEQRLFGKITEEILNTQEDKRRLGVYYLLDWILRQGERELTFKSLLGASQQLSAKIAPTEEIAPDMIRDLIAILLEGEYLVELGSALDQVQIGDLSTSQEKRYKLTARRLAELRGLAGFFEEEAAKLKTETSVQEKIGPYKLLEVVGQGGMGKVYRAWDELQQRLVAIKIIADNLAADPTAVTRFKREAQVLQSLQHPGITKFYELGEAGGRFYLVMEFVEGVNLGDLLAQQRKLEAATAVALAQAAAEILQYVHERGIVRNDVKPGNLLLANNGRVYLMDFGIARQEAESAQELTSTGILVGTPYYMSPEQALGKTVDARSDVYALGVVLYEMITGQRPFAGDSVIDTIMAHVQTTAPPPSQFVPLSPELEALIMKCLEKDPAQRYQTMKDFAQALAQVAESKSRIDLTSLLNRAQAQLQHAKVDKREATKVVTSFAPPVASPPPAAPVAMAPQPAPATTFASVARAYLRVISGPSQVGEKFMLAQAMNNIGRDNSCEIVLRDIKLSKFHARVYEQEGVFYIDDLNSANGTCVNGAQIREHHLLREGDKIQLGGFELEFKRSTATK